MPIQKGHSKEVIASNIKELMDAGHPQKQAIAISLASARKSKMSVGGEVDDMNSEIEPSPGMSHEDEEPEMDMDLVKALRAQHEMESYSSGGEVEDDDEDPEVPAEEDPVQRVENHSMINDETMQTILDYKKRRQFK